MAKFESDRQFEIWNFSASHRTMLLRSNPDYSVGTETRIEVYISNVEEMWIRPRMNGLTLWRPSASEAVEAAVRLNIRDGIESLYLLSSEGFCGFLLAGRPAWREAVRGLEEPTLFDFTQEWPPGSEMKWGNVD